MNKQITLLILGVVLCAMGMIVYFHASSEPESASPGMQAGTSLNGSAASGNGTSAGTEAGSGETAASGQAGANRGNELPRVDPPLSSQSAQNGGQPAVAGGGNQTGGAAGGSQGGGAQSASVQGNAGQNPSTAASGQSSQGAASQGSQTGGTQDTTGRGSQAGSAQGSTSQGNQTGSAQGAASGASSSQSSQLSLTGKHDLKSIGLHFSGQRIFLRIEANDPFPCKTFVLNTPERLVVDLPGTWTGMKAPAVPQNNIIKSARYGVQKAGPRLVLDLEKAPKYEVTRPSPTVVEIYVQ